MPKLIKTFQRAFDRLMREYRYASAGEEQRIAFHREVVHGGNIKLTGKVNFGSEPFLVRLGSNITIADGVRFITHDGAVRIFRDEHPDLHVYAPITVGNDVFIGVNAVIMPGVTIGDRCVIGVGSIVTHDVESGMVVAGIPARPLKTVEEYRDGVLTKAIKWPVGHYDDEWKKYLMGYHF